MKEIGEKKESEKMELIEKDAMGEGWYSIECEVRT